MVIDEGNLRKSIVKLAFPAVAEQFMVMVVGVISMAYAGHLGRQAISAVGFNNTMHTFIISIFVAISTGGTVLVARLIGVGNIEKAKEAIKHSVVLGGILSFVFTGICYIFSENIVKFLFNGAEEEVLKATLTYFRITLYSLPLALLNIIISGTLRGAGNTKTPMLIANAVNILNAILGYILIFGIHFRSIGIKGYGIEGAAVSVAISRTLGGILSIFVLYSKNSSIRVNIFQKFKLDRVIIARILNIGIPSAMEQILMHGGFLVFQIILVRMGTVATAIYQVVMSINTMIMSPMLGFGIAATTLVGQCLGAKKPETAERSVWETQKIALYISIALTIILFIFPSLFLSIYTRDAEVINAGITAIRLYCISQPFLAIVFVLSGGMRGAGDIKYVMVTTFIGIWCGRILLTILLDHFWGFGMNGVWISIIIDFLVRSILYILRFRKGRWKEKEV